ncbi:MAG: FAD-dependent oxidoreductase [Candidatus Binataceae bacterium]
MGDSHAIVIGGSMAGLCAGRVLADFYDKVTLVDRDSYPDGALERAGVPQSRHVHALLKRGRLELENLFPGFDRAMLAGGALDINFTWDFATLRETGWAARSRDRTTTLFASRVLIEATVRGLLRATHSNVQFIERCESIGLEAERNGAARAAGVRLRPRDGGDVFVLRGDLVVDASGRSSKCDAWFKELGFDGPDDTVVDSHTGYASRWYQRTASAKRPPNWWWKGVWIDPIAGDASSAGVLFPVERDRFIITTAGIGGNYPPGDEQGFTAALGSLRSPIIHEEVQLAEPISPVYSNRQMANRWRHYERWPARLDGFVALGDSVCAFNPVYGQGMTTGAVSALILRDCLRRGAVNDVELPRKFFAALAKFQAQPWGLATGADFRFPHTEGRRPRAGRIFDPILQAMFQAGNEDEVVRERIGDVIQMMKQPSSLFGPAILARCALATIRRKLRPKPAPAPIAKMPPLFAQPATA